MKHTTSSQVLNQATPYPDGTQGPASSRAPTLCCWTLHWQMFYIKQQPTEIEIQSGRPTDTTTYNKSNTRVVPTTVGNGWRGGIFTLTDDNIKNMTMNTTNPQNVVVEKKNWHNLTVINANLTKQQRHAQFSHRAPPIQPKKIGHPVEICAGRGHKKMKQVCGFGGVCHKDFLQ